MPYQEDPTKRPTDPIPGSGERLQPGVIMQYIYLPSSPDPKIIASAETVVTNFFSPDARVTNLFVVSADFLRGHNIPHFQKWFARSNNHYLDGYLQHGKTNSDGEDHPYSQKELADIRSRLNALKAMWSQLPEEDRDEVSFFSSLQMLDNIAASRNFRLEVEPMGRMQFANMLKKGKRLLDFFGKDEKIDEEQLTSSTDTYLDHVRKGRSQAYRQMADICRDREQSFSNFLRNTVTQTLGKDSPVHIVVPQQDLSFFLSQPDLYQGNKRKGTVTILPDITFIDQNDSDIQRLARFVQNKDASLERNEVMQMAISDLMHGALASYGMESRAHELQGVIPNSPYEALEELLANVLSTKKDEEKIALLLNYFGEKTGNARLGTMLIALGSMRDELKTIFERGKDK